MFIDPLSRSQAFTGIRAIASTVKQQSSAVINKILGNMFAQPHSMRSHKAMQNSSARSDKTTSVAFKTVGAGPYRCFAKINHAKERGLKMVFTGTPKPHTYSTTPPEGRLFTLLKGIIL